MSLTGYLLSDGITDLSSVFVNINGQSVSTTNTFQQKTIFAGGIDLSNCFLYGRNDGYAFNVPVNSKYPIGFSSSTFASSPSLGNGERFSTSIPIYSGTWIVNSRCFGKGNSTNAGTYSSSASLVLDLSANSNITYMNANIPPKSITPLLPLIPVTLNANPISITTVVKVSLDTTLYATTILTGISGNVGNTIITNIALSITKIA